MGRWHRSDQTGDASPLFVGSFFPPVLLCEQSLAVLQQPPPGPEGVLRPAAAPPEDHRRGLGPHRGEGRPGRWRSLTSIPAARGLRRLISSSPMPVKGFIFAFVWPNASHANRGAPSCVQERQLSDSFRLYTEHCLCLMKNMRQVFPCASDAAITRFELMLR